MKKLILSLLFLSACNDLDLKTQLAARQKNIITLEIKNTKQAKNYSLADLKKLAISEAIKNRINPDLFIKQIKVESSFNPDAIGLAGEIGLAQIMPNTGFDVCGMTKQELKHPELNLMCAAYFLRKLTDRYQSELLAKKHYNGGSGCAVKYKCKQVEAYIQKIYG